MACGCTTFPAFELWFCRSRVTDCPRDNVSPQRGSGRIRLHEGHPLGNALALAEEKFTLHTFPAGLPRTSPGMASALVFTHPPSANDCRFHWLAAGRAALPVHCKTRCSGRPKGEECIEKIADHRERRWRWGSDFLEPLDINPLRLVTLDCLKSSRWPDPLECGPSVAIAWGLMRMNAQSGRTLGQITNFFPDWLWHANQAFLPLSLRTMLISNWRIVHVNRS